MYILDLVMFVYSFRKSVIVLVVIIVLVIYMSLSQSQKAKTEHSQLFHMENKSGQLLQ